MLSKPIISEITDAAVGFFPAPFPIKRVFDIKKSVFIGNRVKYASYALEGGKIQFFIQSRLAKIIRDNMKEKKGKLFLAGAKEQTGSFPGIGYSDVL